MWYLLGLILVAFVVGAFTYILGECNGYFEALDQVGYEYNAEGEIVRKEDVNGTANKAQSD